MVIQSHKTSRPTGDGLKAILELKRKCHFEFFHGNRFPLQAQKVDERCFIFKMSTTSLGSGVDIVECMDANGDGDLWYSWVCFDHVHRIESGWITMGAHVYEPL